VPPRSGHSGEHDGARPPSSGCRRAEFLGRGQRTLGTVIEDLALWTPTHAAALLLGCMGKLAHREHLTPAHASHTRRLCDAGLQREVVQRALKELERDGAITLERTRICIHDQSKLERCAHLSE
jgi:CRP/FNR family transcriptional regulator